MRPAAGLWAAALLAVAVALLLSAAPPAEAEPALPDGFQDSVAIGGLSQPTAFRFAPDGRVFVAQKGGKILAFDGVGGEAGEPELFADLSAEVYDHVDRGLLGLAVDPDFPAEPYVYALYTYDHVLGDSDPAPKWGDPESPEGDECAEPKGSDDCVVSGRLVRLEADGTGEHAVETTGGEPRQTVLAEGWCQQFSSHSVGDLEFGPEGALYASGGDGASFTSADYGQFGEPPNPCGEPPGEEGETVEAKGANGGSFLAQDPRNLNGSIIRIDPETGAAWPDNPDSGDPGADPRIVAYGFRNPFRFTLDPRTGEMYAANVGSSEIEEIDRFAAPPATTYNSGWPCFEGVARQFQFEKYENPICEALYEEEEEGLEPVSEPFFYYPHGQPVVGGDECPAEYGSAVSGVGFYENDALPSKYRGAFFFADSVRGCMYVMLAGEDGRPDPSTTTRFMREARIYPGVDIQAGPDGALYYASLFGDESYAPGAIHRIAYVPGAPEARLAVDRSWDEEEPYEFHLDASESTDPDGGSLEYDWDLDGDGAFELQDAAAEQDLEVPKAVNRTVTVRVTDGEGKTGAAKLTLYPGDAPPAPEIAAPGEDLEWKVGDRIHFSGTATDGSGAEMHEPNYFYWSARLYHCPGGEDHCHAHPLQTFKGVKEGELLAPEHDVPTYIQLTLRVTDKRGLSASQTVSVYPRLVDLTIESDPQGIEMNAGVSGKATPFVAPAIEGAKMELTAPLTATLDGRTYRWESWSDAGPRSHTVTADADRTYVARYEEVAEPEAEPEEEPEPEPERQPEKQPELEEEPASGGGSRGGSPSPPSESGPSQEAGRPWAVVRRPRFRRHPARLTRLRFAVLALRGGPHGAAPLYRCRVDRRPARLCRVPLVLRRLRPGPHVFAVMALYPRAHARSRVAAFRWVVLCRRSRPGYRARRGAGARGSAIRRRSGCAR